MHRNLYSTSDVIDALGGTKPVCSLLQVKEGAVSVWRVHNLLPPHTFPTISQELLKRGLAADLSLWRWDRKRKAVGE
jgi:hypothetical protein